MNRSGASAFSVPVGSIGSSISKEEAVRVKARRIIAMVKDANIPRQDPMNDLPSKSMNAPFFALKYHNSIRQAGNAALKRPLKANVWIGVGLN